MPWKDETELLAFAKKLEGKKFSEISESIGKLDENHRKHTKGVAAKVIETGYFEIPSNSSEHPDFEELGIELKVSPLRYLPKLDIYTTKERNVIKMVDYNDLADNNHWKLNKVAKKLNRILFVLYVHDNEANAWDWKVVKTFLWSPNEAESQALKADYDIMRSKVLAGEHLRRVITPFSRPVQNMEGVISRRHLWIHQDLLSPSTPFSGLLRNVAFVSNERPSLNSSPMPSYPASTARSKHWH